MGRRLDRLNDLLQEEISALLREVKDPRLAGLVTITRVAVSEDLAHARVFFSVLGTPEEWESTQRALASAAGFLRRELSHRLTLRRIPELHFTPDTSLEKAGRVLDLLHQLSTERKTSPME
ncbi:MAG: 30S ribosome-binding factor RbfA [Dehalococcoidia bacterium]|nr:30S ribosome-binding factor RbfA [Dehalococcoidia bacterium]MDW8119665.1 30S ribosome-binding factor RbfA [Chloroflexota bacterium]